MPIYEYKCPTCGDRAEIVRPVERCDDELHCAICGDYMKRVMSAAGFSWKSPPANAKPRSG